MNITILMIDDHPMLIEGYKSILSFNTKGYTIETEAVYDSKSAYETITNPKNKNRFQMVFIDRALPIYEEQNIFSGEDLAVLVKKEWASAKIAMITSHTEAIILNQILKKINPDALLVKSELSSETLHQAFEALINNQNYYTQTVLQLKKSHYDKNHYLDHYNSQILLLLASGIQTKNLSAHLHLSESAIKKRKANIKELLGIEKGNDEDLLREAKNKGYI